jgi:hypothetical protein
MPEISPTPPEVKIAINIYVRVIRIGNPTVLSIIMLNRYERSRPRIPPMEARSAD